MPITWPGNWLAIFRHCDGGKKNWVHWIPYRCHFSAGVPHSIARVQQWRLGTSLWRKVKTIYYLGMVWINTGGWWQGVTYTDISDWWFGTCFIFPYIGTNNPKVTSICFRGVGQPPDPQHPLVLLSCDSWRLDDRGYPYDKKENSSPIIEIQVSISISVSMFDDYFI